MVKKKNSNSHIRNKSNNKQVKLTSAKTNFLTPERGILCKWRPNFFVAVLWVNAWLKKRKAHCYEQLAMHTTSPPQIMYFSLQCKAFISYHAKWPLTLPTVFFCQQAVCSQIHPFRSKSPLSWQLIKKWKIHRLSCYQAMYISVWILSTFYI